MSSVTALVAADLQLPGRAATRASSQSAAEPRTQLSALASSFDAQLVILPASNREAHPGRAPIRIVAAVHRELRGAVGVRREIDQRQRQEQDRLNVDPGQRRGLVAM